jgi:serine/threonine protein kinase
MSDSDQIPGPDQATKLFSDESKPRPGAPPSHPSDSHYAIELPYAEELQVLLGNGYIVESFLGQGGMGAVYKGLQMPLKRPVAIKILQRKGQADDFGFEERFKREAYAMAGLTHPNIVQVYDCGDAGENFLFISMELVEGGDLSDAIKERKITPEGALKLIAQICDGLQAAHERGIVHRDIKPANIFLTKDGRAKVADFGLAKKFNTQSTFVTQAGLGMGTPDYAAPEQFEGAPDIDHRADIYALGVMIYQMLTGALPRGNYKPASQRVGTDPRIDVIIAKAMENDRADRYQSAAEIKAALAAIAASPPRNTVPATSVATTAAGSPPTKPVTHAPTARTPSPPARRVPSSAVAGRAVPEERRGRSGLIATAITLAVVAIAAPIFLKSRPSVVPSASNPAAPSGNSPSFTSPSVPVTVKQERPALVPQGLPHVAGDLRPTPAYQELKAKGGRLRVEGVIREAPVDISVAHAYDDFVEVYASGSGWLATRVTGETLAWGTDIKKSFAFRCKGVSNLARSSDITFLMPDGSFGMLQVNGLERKPIAAAGKALVATSSWAAAMALDANGILVGSLGRSIKDVVPPPADFFRGTINFASGPNSFFAAFDNQPPKTWHWGTAKSFTFPPEFADCVQIATKNDSVVAMRTRSGKVLMGEGHNPNRKAEFKPPADLPPAMQVRAGPNIVAAQSTDGRWRAWGTGESLISRINQIGTALDLDVTQADPAKGFLIWIEPK